MPRKNQLSFFSDVSLVCVFLIFTQTMEKVTSEECNGVPYDISMTTFDGNIGEIAWIKSPVGLGGLSGFVRTDSNSVWRSDDAGATWTIINQLLDNFNKTPTYNCDGNCKGAAVLVPSSDNFALFIVGFEGRIWVFRGDTNSYDVYWNPNVLLYLLFPHPTNRAVLAATHVTPCCYLPTSSCDTCYVSLSLSDNWGASWSLIQTYVLPGYDSVAWLKNTAVKEPAAADLPPPVSLFYSHYTRKSGNMRLMRPYATQTELVKVHDFRFPRTTSTPVVLDGFSVFWAGNRLFALRFDRMSMQGVQLMSSLDGETFRQENLSLPPSADVLSSEISEVFPAHVLPDGKVFLSVRRDATNRVNSDVYVVDTAAPPDTAIKFSFASLRRGLPSEMISAKEAIGNYRSLFVNRLATRDARDAITSLSLDGGLSWFAPRGSPDDRSECSDDEIDEFDDVCHFHFTQSLPDTNHFADAINAPGVFLATGNVGRTLSLDKSEMNSFISTDAGVTWKQIEEGSNLVLASSKAETLLLMKDSDATTSFKTSFDTGSSWNECEPSQATPFAPVAGVSDPLESVSRFLVLGSTSVSNGSRDTLMYLRFTPEGHNATECVYPNDYEKLLIPTTQGCVLGKRLQIMRKKPDIACKETGSTMRLLWETCECTTNDYVCDECFGRTSRGSCEFIMSDCPKHELTRTLQSCKTMFVSNITGYVRNPLSSCENGTNPSFGQRAYSCSPPVIVATPPPPPPPFDIRVLPTEPPKTSSDSRGGGVPVVLAVPAAILGVFVFLVICIYVARFFRKRYAASHQDVEGANTTIPPSVDEYYDGLRIPTQRQPFEPSVHLETM